MLYAVAYTYPMLCYAPMSCISNAEGYVVNVMSRDVIFLISVYFI